jgi:RNA recognition motif-containing protein
LNKKLFVGNLSYNTSDMTLEAAFAEHGEVVSANVVTDRTTGRSRGFGFVEMATEEAAQAAINSLNGTSLDGREINVAEARPRRDRGSDRGGYGGGSYGGGGGYNRW